MIHGTDDAENEPSEHKIQNGSTQKKVRIVLLFVLLTFRIFFALALLIFRDFYRD